MKRGMEERVQEKSCALLKNQMEPLEVYQVEKRVKLLKNLFC